MRQGRAARDGAAQGATRERHAERDTPPPAIDGDERARTQRRPAKRADDPHSFTQRPPRARRERSHVAADQVAARGQEKRPPACCGSVASVHAHIVDGFSATGVRVCGAVGRGGAWLLVARVAVSSRLGSTRRSRGTAATTSCCARTSGRSTPTCARRPPPARRSTASATGRTAATATTRCARCTRRSVAWPDVFKRRLPVFVVKRRPVLTRQSRHL